MNYFFFFLIMVIFAGMDVQPKNKFNQENYLAHSQTRCIEGIFVLLVIFSHFKNSYITPGQNDMIYWNFQNHMGQNIVTMFMFYSGFGMMSGIGRKGISYVRTIPTKFVKLHIRFVLAVFLFAILQGFYGNTYSFSKLVLSVIGRSSTGNSNWYIFTMLCIYCCFYLSFLFSYRLFQKNADYIGAGFLSLLCFALLLCLREAGKPPYWYNTIIAFVAGVWYCKFQKIGQYCMKNDTSYYIILSIVASMYALATIKKGSRLLWYEIWVVLFAVIVLLISMKISLFSPLLDFLGSHVFSIYILQRIPMIVLSQAGFTEVHPYCSLILVICCTFILAVLFDWFSDRVLFRQGAR